MFTSAELAELRAWDEEVDRADITAEERHASDRLEACAILERTGRRATESKIEATTIVMEERKRKAREQYASRKASGKQKLYNAAKRHEAYVKNDLRYMESQDAYRKKQAYKRTESPTREANSECTYCGNPLCIPDRQLHNASGTHFCNNACRLAFRKKFGAFWYKNKKSRFLEKSC